MASATLLSLGQEMTADEGQGSETGDGERLKVNVVEDERGRGSSQNILLPFS